MAYLLLMLESEPVTFWDSAPATLQQLNPFLAEGALESAPLRLVFLSGDWIPVPLPDRVRGRFPRAQVVALGGATEATVWSNYCRVGEVDGRWPSIPYGKPLQNARYYVLSRERQPCPVGLRGELYIGECLALGYLGDAELTAAKFIPDPFSSEAGGRLYQTGDCARWRADGNLEFLGRADDQVKIRGYRIELGEIEAALREKCGVRELCFRAARVPLRRNEITAD